MTNFNEIRDRLIASRPLEKEDDITVYYEIHDLLLTQKIYELDLVYLFLYGFYDDTTAQEFFHGWKEDLYFLSEKLPNENVLKILIESVNILLPHAEKMYKEITIDLLSMEDTNKNYKSSLDSVDPTTKSKVINQLAEIVKMEDPFDWEIRAITFIKENIDFESYK